MKNITLKFADFILAGIIGFLIFKILENRLPKNIQANL